jgi:carotenoid cleavage dioxygenase-like enzyme
LEVVVAVAAGLGIAAEGELAFGSIGAAGSALRSQIAVLPRIAFMHSLNVAKAQLGLPPVK